MQVRELQLIDPLSSLLLVTGEAGLDRPMKDVVLLEYESLNSQVEDYYKDDFIVSTMYAAKDAPDRFLYTVRRLIEMGAAGLAVKSVYFPVLPEEVLALAEQNDFPIFKFDNIYMEDVILCISDYIRQRQEYSQFEEPLFRIIQGTSDAYGTTEEICERMNPGRQKYMCAAYIHSQDVTHEWSAPLKNALQLRSYRDMAANFRFLQFRRGFFVICNYPKPVPLSEVGQAVISTLEDIGCSTDRLSIGVGSFYQKAEEFDIVVVEAFNALLTALLRNENLIVYPDMKLYHAVFAVARDRINRRAMIRLLQDIKAYDSESTNGFLFSTLQTHAKCNYDIKETARVMNQHPNTIRYRLKKICDLTASPLEYDHALFLMGEYLRLDALSASIF